MMGVASTAQRLRRRARAVPAPLVVIIAVAALQAVAWAVVFAPFQGPDESDHFAYVQHLAETGSPPSFPGGSGTGVSSEEASALDYLNLATVRGVLGAREAWNPIEQRQWRRLQSSVPPGGRANGSGPNPLAKNPPLYYAYEAVPYTVFAGTGLFSRLFVMRLASGVLYVTTVVLAWLLAAEVFSSTWLRVIAGGVVALHPELAAQGGAISADVLLATIWTGFMLTGVRILKRGPTPSRIATLLGLAGASALTHGRGLPLLVPTLALLAMLFWRLPNARRRLMAKWIAASSFAVVGAFAIYRFLLVKSPGGLYGGELRFDGHSASLGGFISNTWQFYFPRMSFMEPRIGPPYGFRQVLIETYYGTFASLDVRLPLWTFDLLQIASVALVVAVVLTLTARWSQFSGRWSTIVFLSTPPSALLLFLHLASYRALVGSPQDPLIVGRYVLPLTALLGLGVAFVLGSLPRRLGACAGAVVLASGVLLQLTALVITATRFYA